MRRGCLIFLGWACIVANSLMAESKPLLVLMDFNAWFPSSGPSLVVYDDGLIIYQVPKEILVRERNDYTWVKEFQYMATRVPDAAVFIQSMFPYSWAALKSKYELSAATDQVSTLLWHRGQIVEIYGDWRRFLEIDHYANFDHGREMVEQENALRRSLPKGFREFLQRLDCYADEEAKPWLPEIVNISLYKYNRTFGNPVTWPSEFPQPMLVQHGSNPEFVEGHVALPAKHYLQFRELVSRLTSPDVVVIEGTNFILSNFTFPFPGEWVWENDLTKKAEREKTEMLKEIEKLPAEKQKEIRKLLGL